jgi:integrase
MTPDEARTFLQAVRGDRLEALYAVALAVGLRQGEALGLRWQDVDLEGVQFEWATSSSE